MLLRGGPGTTGEHEEGDGGGGEQSEHGAALSTPRASPALVTPRGWRADARRNSEAPRSSDAYGTRMSFTTSVVPVITVACGGCAANGLSTHGSASTRGLPMFALVKTRIDTLELPRNAEPA